MYMPAEQKSGTPKNDWHVAGGLAKYPVTSTVNGPVAGTLSGSIGFVPPLGTEFLSRTRFSSAEARSCAKRAGVCVSAPVLFAVCKGKGYVATRALAWLYQ